jgi:hypothetical protein
MRLSGQVGYIYKTLSIAPAIPFMGSLRNNVDVNPIIHIALTLLAGLQCMLALIC